MNALPYAAQAALRLFGGWTSITNQVNEWAVKNDKPTYSTAPTKYQFSGIGVVGFPPKVAFNVKYIDGLTGQVLDLGKIVAQ